MSVSILVVDDEPDVADLFRQRFRREARQGTYVMHFAASGRRLWIGWRGRFSPRWLPSVGYQHARHGWTGIARQDQTASS